MELREVISIENDGKKFRCVDNGWIVRNDKGILLFRNKQFDDGGSYWRQCSVSKIWIESKYDLVEEE